MAWMFVLGECVVCRSLFSFNADRVPSIVVRGTREPVCRACVERANPLREKNGLQQIVILPGAYEAGEGGLMVKLDEFLWRLVRLSEMPSFGGLKHFDTAFPVPAPPAAKPKGDA